MWGCTAKKKETSTSKSVDLHPPVLIERIKLDYPEKLRIKGIEGTVVLNLYISDSGEVKESKIYQSSGNDSLDKEALDYTNQLKFKPAMDNGIPINTWLSWTVNFRLSKKDIRCLPEEYVANIKNLFQLVNRSDGKVREDNLKKILEAHDTFISCPGNYDIDYYHLTADFIVPQIYNQWKIFSDDFTITFPAYDDLIRRFPKSEISNEATNMFIDQVNRNINTAKFFARRNKELKSKKDLFLKTIYQYLDNNYPQLLDNEMREEAAKYLK